MWSELRDRKLGGFKFRRQQPIGPYIADFCCAQAKLVVEIDGSMHNRVRDARRDEWMQAEGYLTLRVVASDVSTNLDGVLRTILRTCRNRTGFETE